jgi:predicted ATPase/transcriptional regulator with XRE-family HTH domain
MTQEALAERAGLSVKTVSDLERNPTRTPRFDTAALIADALGLEGEARSQLLQTVRIPHAATLPDLRRAAMPRPLSPLVGRDDTTASILQTLTSGAQLLTLTGPGGIGKTRLALHVAERAVHDFPDGVVFVDLSPIRDPSMVLPAIAKALGFDERGADPLDERLAGSLRGTRMLLILDNFEQVIGARISLTALLASCPHVVALVTSREALRVRGEHEQRILPLALPPPAAMPEDLLNSAAVQFFMHRAQDLGVELALEEAVVRAMADICRRLDGLPLAIELATAWLPVLPPTALLARLDRRLPLLTNGPQDLPQRQQTMRDVIRWSYELLEPQHQALFRRLSVFAGGATVAAIEVVGVADGDVSALGGIAALINASLLQRTSDAAGAGEPRMRMLETVREYAEELLRDSDEEELLHRRHRNYYNMLAEQVEARHEQHDYERALHEVEAEHDNLRVALERSLTSAPDAGLELVRNLWRYWRVRGHHVEALRWMGLLLPQVTVPSMTTVLARVGAGALLVDIGDYGAARNYFRDALDDARQIADAAGIGLALTHMGTLSRREGQYQAARACLEEALGLPHDAMRQWDRAIVLRELGNLERAEANYAQARARLEASLAIAQGLRSRRAIGWALSDLALLARAEGDRDAALALLEESVSLFSEGNDLYDLAWTIARLGDVSRIHGDLDRAWTLFRDSVGLFERVGATNGLITTVYFAGIAAIEQREVMLGLQLLAAAAVHDPDRTLLYPPERADVETALADARSALAADAFDHARQERQADSLAWAMDTIRSRSAAP